MKMSSVSCKLTKIGSTSSGGDSALGGGRSSLMFTVASGAATMKMMSSTSITSTNGVTLISALSPNRFLAPPLLSPVPTVPAIDLSILAVCPRGIVLFELERHFDDGVRNGAPGRPVAPFLHRVDR